MSNSSKIVEMIRLIFCLLAALFSLQLLAATQLNEEVIFVPKKMLIGSIPLETTIFKPNGNGPFPLVIINHGKSFGNSHFQNRYRPLSPIRYFLERNYVVFVPMRQGFSKSGGNYSDGSCSMKANGLLQAEDIQPVIEYAHGLPYVDKVQTLIVGQSHGGWTTLAYGASKPDQSVKGLVNFAGGLKNESCGGWQSDLYRTAEDFGKATKVPTIWFYGDNDSFFSRQTSDAMFERYRVGNPQSQFIAYGTFGSDSHRLD
jgi:dienelactone hydrolase